ncbi:phosphoribosylglycinamide formyltransferase [Gilvimarinus sp. F26214L]|uniref:phosphoribosylglycinamide formyltransferase n=1 Tax=Gilvimarinus sp. DZF01 TaxID=3461371 RepID=UPI004045C200
MSNPARIAVLISGSGTNLQALIDAQQAGQLSGQIVAVVSNRPGVKGLARAQKAGIPTQVVDHRDFRDREAFDKALALALDQYRPDLLVLAGFMRILTPGFVAHYQGRMMNIHPSLLPKYPGLHTHRRALEAGDTHHGVTVHFVTDQLDGGPPIIQARIPVLPGDTEESLQQRVLQQEHRIYPMAVQWFAEGRLHLNGSRCTFDGELLPPQGHLIDATP